MDSIAITMANLWQRHAYKPYICSTAPKDAWVLSQFRWQTLAQTCLQTLQLSRYRRRHAYVPEASQVKSAARITRKPEQHGIIICFSFALEKNRCCRRFSFVLVTFAASPPVRVACAPHAHVPRNCIIYIFFEKAGI